MTGFWIAAACLLSALPQDSPPEFKRFPPVPAARTGESFRVRNGFRLDVVAAEPLVMDPVAAAFDEDGRLYVVEMSDYPHVKAENDKPFAENLADPPVGRVRVLIDTDDDGVFDQSRIFAEKLSWPTGLALYKGGVFVAATPDIVYLKDNDGDFKADTREIVFSGFRKFNVQAVMNNLQWTLEHKIIGAGSSNGGSIKRPDRPDAKPVNVLRRDFRFDPATREIEVVSGGARFGNAVDDWGNRFLCDIRNPAEHVVLPLRYLERNPYLSATKVLHDTAVSGDAVPVFRISPAEPWREFRARRWSSIGRKMPRSELFAAGFLTSSSGLTVYRGDAYPADFRGNLFLGEVANNLIFRMKVEPDGVTFKAERADPGVEFVASEDTWFRPVNFVNAPDGTLHLLDMYRETIEHPWSIPDDIRARLDLRSGEDRGRVYRITPPGFRRRSTPKLGSASTAELVKLLSHPNAWHRDTAHRLLFEGQDRAAVPLLRERLARGDDPLARLHSLWSLEGMNALSDAEILRAIDDPRPEIREHALRLAEPRLKKSPALVDAVRSRANDDTKRVVFQAAFTLGEIDDPRVVDSLATIAEKASGDPFVVKAILSSSGRSASALFRTIWNRGEATRAKTRELLPELAVLAGASRSESDPSEILKLVLADSSARTYVASLARGLKLGGRSLATVRAKLDPTSAERLDGLAAAELRVALDERNEPERRVEAISFLAESGGGDWLRPTLGVLESNAPTAVRVAALKSVATRTDREIPALILKGWNAYPPALRTVATDAMLSRRERIPPLLEAVESGLIPAGQIPVAKRTALRSDRDPAIRALASKLFAETVGPRAAVVSAYKPAIEKPGESLKGRLVYERECASCHKLGDRGFEVGPNLAGVLRRTPDELLIHILDPNREVSPDFVEYVAALKDGRTVSGIVTAETASGVTLRKAGGIEETFLKSQVEELKGTGKSLMPEGLEKNVKPEEMADLLAYLLNLQRQ